MSTKNARQTQHKPPREERKNKELQSLKRENHKLARKNAQLQKELTRAIQVRDNFEAEPEGGERVQEEMPGEGMKCPDCGATTVRSLVLAGKTYFVCAECRWRRPADKPL